MKRTYTYMIPGAPVTKKNSQRICVNRATGRSFIKPSAAYESYETVASYFLSPKPDEPLDFPVCVTCVYYMPTRRRVDLSNLMASTHDLLVKYRILSDDNRDVIASVDGSRVYYDKENPRVEITVQPYNDGNYVIWKKEK